MFRGSKTLEIYGRGDHQNVAAILFDMKVRVIPVLAVLCVLVAFSSAQEPAIRVDEHLVAVPTAVLDRNGRYITNLSKRDFTVRENDLEQEIVFFQTVESPFTALLLLDLSGSMNDHIPELAQSVEAFVDQLRNEDQLIVAGFVDDSNIRILQEPIRKKDFRKRIHLGMTSGDSYTTTFDAVAKSMRYMNRIEGRKAIVLFTDGELFGRGASAKSTLREAQEQEAAFYTIRFGEYPTHQPGLRMEGSQFPYERRIGDGELKKLKSRVTAYLEGLSYASGGRSFDIDKVGSLEKTFRNVAAELGQQYLIVYSPAMSPKEGERRRITVNVSVKDVAVRARREVVFRSPRK